MNNPISILPQGTPDDAMLDSRAGQEAVFCQEFVRHGDAVMACIRAGIVDQQFPVGITARNLLEREDIKLGIRLLQAEAHGAIPVEATRESEIADMERVFQTALNNGKLDTAIAAKRLKTALMGLLIDRKEITHIKGAEDMTREELQRIAYKGRVIEGTAVSISDGGIGDGGGYDEE